MFFVTGTNTFLKEEGEIKMSTTTDAGSQVESKLQGVSFCPGRPYLHIYPFLFIAQGAQWEPEVFAQTLLSLPQDDSVTGLCLPLVGLPNKFLPIFNYHLSKSIQSWRATRVGVLGKILLNYNYQACITSCGRLQKRCLRPTNT